MAYSAQFTSPTSHNGQEASPHSCHMLANCLKRTLSLPMPAMHQNTIDDRSRQLSLAIDELIQTERTFIDDMRMLVEVFLDQMSQQNWISSCHTARVRRNSREILAFHRNFLYSFNMAIFAHHGAPIELEMDKKCHTIAMLFLQSIDQFAALYNEYCQGHLQAWAVCLDYRNKAEWVTFSHECHLLLARQAKDPSHKSAQFEDILIRPIQRICRYQLLLKEIIRRASKTNPNVVLIRKHTWISLYRALESMDHIAAQIDKDVIKPRATHQKATRSLQIDSRSCTARYSQPDENA
ncbi:Dbl homology domain-containing protein [Gongronella butleri]|nr:Dbl homology domain-containing protein [Gongronella butleri]